MVGLSFFFHLKEPVKKQKTHKNYILIWKGNYCSPLHFYRICNTTSLPIALLSVNEGKTEASKKRSTVNVHINFKQILNMECTKVERSNKKKKRGENKKRMNEWMNELERHQYQNTTILIASFSFLRSKYDSFGIIHRTNVFYFPPWVYPNCM